ncbi:MAG: hypothetical protein JW969_01125 [Spirochaetales bacterium]|nr:hypothetical protein [Spirochaetales bacterium]
MVKLKLTHFVFMCLAAVALIFSAGSCVSGGTPTLENKVVKVSNGETFTYDDFEGGIDKWQAVIGYNGYAASAAGEKGTVNGGSESMKITYGGKAQWGIAEFAFAPIPGVDHAIYTGIQMDVYLANEDQVEVIYRTAGDKLVFTCPQAVESANKWVTLQFPFDDFAEPGWHKGNSVKKLEDAFIKKTKFSALTVLVLIRKGAVNKEFTGYIDNVVLY